MVSYNPNYSQDQSKPYHHSQDRSHADSQDIRHDGSAFGVSMRFPFPEGIMSFCCVEQQGGGGGGGEGQRIHEPGSQWLVKFDSLAKLWHFLKQYDTPMYRWKTLDGCIERPSYRIKEIIYEHNMVKLLVIRSPWENLK